MAEFCYRFGFTYGCRESKVCIVGDRWRDVEAGKNAECKTIFIDFKYQEKLISEPDYIVNNISDCKNIVKKIIK